MIDPLGISIIIRLMESAIKILTDPGGIQKEAYMLGSTLHYIKREY